MNPHYIKLLHDLNNLLLSEKKPSLYLRGSFGKQLLQVPEISAMLDCPQDPIWHPEGDVWQHTILVVDRAAELKSKLTSATDQSAFMLGAFFHDIGKPLTTVYKDNRWRSPAHDIKGSKICRNLLTDSDFSKEIIDKASSFVLEHLKPINLYKYRDNISDTAIRRLARRVNIEQLIYLAMADHFGRTTPDALAKEFPAGPWLLAKHLHIEKYDNKPKPILKGRHLAKYGVKPGSLMGKLISESLIAQIDGEIQNVNDAKKWAYHRLLELGYIDPGNFSS